MTQEQHPITPPPELVQQWINEDDDLTEWRVAIQAARWGADMELEACINHFHEYDTSWGEDSDLIAGLRAARRPKPPSLKEQALDELDRVQTHDESGQEIVNLSVIRRAIEALPD